MGAIVETILLLALIVAFIFFNKGDAVENVSLVALVVACISLVYTAKTFRLKSGKKIRFSYTTKQSTETDDVYVNSITIENIKDKPIVVFAIYLEISRGMYLTLEEFEEKPLIIPAFSAYQKEYGPPYLYSVNLKRVKIDHILNAKHSKTRLILSTPDGKYVVKTYFYKWKPIYDSFNNILCHIISPSRVVYKDKSYGRNVLYVIDFTHKDGDSEIIPVYSGKYNILKNVTITEKDVENKGSLDKLIRENIENGNIICNSYFIIDFSEYKMRMEKEYSNDDIIRIPQYSTYQYFVGWILGMWETIKHRWDIQCSMETSKMKQILFFCLGKDFLRKDK